jgi:hypothetical protein
MHSQYACGLAADVLDVVGSKGRSPARPGSRKSGMGRTAHHDRPDVNRLATRQPGWRAGSSAGDGDRVPQDRSAAPLGTLKAPA